MEDIIDYDKVYVSDLDELEEDSDNDITFGAFSKTRVGLNKNYTKDDFEDVRLSDLLSEPLISTMDLEDDDFYSDEEDEASDQQLVDNYDALCISNFNKILEQEKLNVKQCFKDQEYWYNMAILEYIKLIVEKKFLYCFAYKKRPYEKDDFLLSDEQLIKEEVDFIHRSYTRYEADVKKHFFPYLDIISLFENDYTSNLYKDNRFQTVITQMNCICHFIYKVKVNTISVFEQQLESYYSKTDPVTKAYETFVFHRRTMLQNLRYTELEQNQILATEDAFIKFRAQMKGSKFRQCPLIDKLSDQKCIDLFRFRRKHIKLLARIFGILPCYVNVRSVAVINKEDMSVNYKQVKKKIKCCPIVQLCIYLHRQAHSTILSTCELIFDFKKTKINDIEIAVCQFLYEKFSHLLSIDNCIYNETYMAALVKKSTLNGSDVKPNTCYLIDETRIRICKPSKLGKQNEDVTYTGSKGFDSLTFHVVTDLFGFIIDVGEPQVGSTDDMRLFLDSGFALRMENLTYQGVRLRILGDAAYRSFGSSIPEYLDFVEKKSIVTNLIQRRIQKNNSRIRCGIERTFGLYKNIMKSLDAKHKNRVFKSALPPQFIVNALILNAKQILYKTTTSGVLSNILSIDRYFLLWGRESDKILLYDHYDRHRYQITAEHQKFHESVFGS
ncbi:hypothetical protein QEN19_003434 [Hanseniaspora menglaensis]